MKKLGLIIMLALVLTVGGVYATFNYAQKEIEPANASLGLTLAGKDTETEKGTIAVDARGYMIRVDDKDGTLKTKYEHQGSISVTFTPAKGADDDVTQNGIKLKLEITINGNNLYKGTPILKLTDAYTNVGHVELNGGNKVKGTINGINLAPYIEVLEYSLPTADDYDAYAAAFGGVSITITVSEAA